MTPYLRPSIWIVYLVLFTVAVPWYWPAGDERTLLGVPLWAAVAVGASAVVSAFTMWLLLTRWPSADDDPGAAP